MKSHSTEFGVRGNTASSRPHDPRLEASSPSPQPARAVELLPKESVASISRISNIEVLDLPLNDANVATAGSIQDRRQLLTVEEVAVRLGVSRNWVYGHSSELGVYRLGKYLRFSWPRVLERLGQ
jgi:predicted DNA-binding transcriptional regulator AlpA